MIHLAMIDLMARRLTGETTPELARNLTRDQKRITGPNAQSACSLRSDRASGDMRRWVTIRPEQIRWHR